MIDIPVEMSAGADKDALEIVTDSSPESIEIQRALVYILLDDDQGTPGFELSGEYTSSSIDALIRELNSRVNEFNSQLAPDDLITDVSIDRGTSSRGRVSLNITVTTKTGAKYNTEVAEYV